MTNRDFDLIIIGAGPAGMAAARTSRALDLRVAVLDEQPEPGGQIYRGIETIAAARPDDLEILGPDYAHGLELARAFREAAVDYRPASQVWQVDRGRVFYRCSEHAAVLTAKRVLISTGAMERPMPVPGWTLPGVLTCGAAQTLFKAASLLPRGRVVLAGCGPLLLLFAAQLTRAGLKPSAVLETAVNRWAALPHLPRFLTAPGYAAKGWAILRELRRAGVPIRKGVTALRICGEDRAREIEYVCSGAVHREPVDAVLLHQGVVPNGNLAWSLRLKHAWSEAQRCFRPEVDAWGRSSVESIYVAGDSAGIIGARAAQHAGELAAWAIAADLGRIDAQERDRQTASIRTAHGAQVAARPFLDALYKPGAIWLAPADPDTIVCRCEEVRAGTIRELVAQQRCPGPNQMKAFVRCGMGPCQGRLCGLTVVELIAECRGVSPAEIGYYRIRSPIKPVAVGHLAQLDLGGGSA